MRTFWALVAAVLVLVISGLSIIAILTFKPWAAVGAPFLVALLIGIALTLVGALGLVVIKAMRGNLDLFGANSGGDFFQGYVTSWQTVFVVAGLVYVGVQTWYLTDGIKTNVVQTMVTNQRELFGKVVEDPELVEAWAEVKANQGGAAPAPQEEKEILKQRKLKMYRSMIFNHAFNAFTLHEHGYIDEDWWNAIKRDMQDVLKTAPMQAHWSTVKTVYPSRFQTFVDSEILDP